ncbi:MAG TPA: hypothetical protein VN851_01430 [Thermoanaerobaculia bacterium]|nr:hypothetical protein [Thermoanaerobaculia bacterium]
MTIRSAVWLSIIAAGWSALALSAAAETPAVLVKDVAPGLDKGSILSIESRVVFGDEAYFAADDGFLGEELWATDGTPRGTRLVADLCPGRCAGSPQAFTPSGDLLFFVAGNTTTGDNTFWVWRTDGTDEGTFPLADLDIDVFGSAGPISYLSPFRGGAVFLVRNGGRSGYDLWRTDGTRAGTQLLFALPGEFGGLRTPDNRRHPFLSEPGSEVVRFDWQGVPWVTDGTARGTHPVAELPIVLCQEDGWVEFDHRLIYAGGDESKGCEPWTTDGTPEGTRRLRDLYPGTRSSFPYGFWKTRNGVYFTAFDRYGRSRLWKTDGTTEGTIQVRTPRPERPLNRAFILGTAGSRVYFSADDGVHGTELWKTDGNPATTQLVADLTPGSGGSQFIFGLAEGDGLYFFAFAQGYPDVLWHTGGTAASTVRIPGVTTIVEILGFRGRILFDVEPAGGGKALAENDGTADGTQILFHGRPAVSSNPASLTSTSKGLLFTTGDGFFINDVWRTDGRRSGTHLLTDFSGQAVRPRLFSDRDGVFLYDFGHENSLLWSDGGPEPPRTLVTDPELGSPDGFVETGAGTAFFLGRGSSDGATLELWRSDSTPSGTVPLAVIDPVGNYRQIFVTPGPEPGSATFMYQVDTSSIDLPSGLYSTDGTSEGTRALGSLALPDFTSVLGLFATAGRSFLVLLEEGSDSASILWATDGTPGGTRELFRIGNPFDHSFISEVAPAGDRFYFTGDDPSAGREVWVTDGTREGTTRVANVAPGRDGSNPSDLFAFGSRLFFGADDGAHGREPWVTDGTPAGTRQIEIRSGPRGSYPQGFAAVGDHVVFAADDGVHGLEMWVSDGTQAGTRLVSDVMPGRLGSAPTGFARFGADVYFSAGRPNIGYELFRVPVSAFASP